MQVLIMDQVFEIDNNDQCIVSLFDLIKKSLEGTPFYFSHLVVDGLEVYDHFEATLNQIENIKSVEVIVKTLNEYIYDCLSNASTYLQRALPEIIILAEELEAGPGSQTWANFADFLEGMDWILQVVNSSHTAGYDHESSYMWQKLLSSLPIHLQHLDNQMKNGDYYMMAETIQNKIIPLLESLNQHISLQINKMNKN